MALDSCFVWQAAGCVINLVGLSRCISGELNEDDREGWNPIGGFFLLPIDKKGNSGKVKGPLRPSHLTLFP